MLDGAMMQVPQIKQAEPIRSKTNRDSSFLDSRTNLNADKREDSFQKKLDSKLDKGNRNQDKAPDKQADSKLPREREDHRGPHDSKMARKEIAQKPKTKENTGEQSSVNKEREDLSEEKNSKVQAQNIDYNMMNTQIPEIQPAMQKTVEEDAAANIDAMKMSLLQWSQSKERHPVLKFMDSMESELGIEPDRLISAFGGLSDKELLQNPEMSAESYIQALNVAPEGQERAQELYSKLLLDLRLQKANKSDVSKLVPMEVQSLLKEMNATDAHPALMAKGPVDDMTKKFFDVYPNRFGRPMEQEKTLDPNLSQAVNPEVSSLDASLQNAEGDWNNPVSSIHQKQKEDTQSALARLALFGAAGAATQTAMEAPDAGMDVEAPDWLSKLNKVDAAAESNVSSIRPDASSEGEAGEGGFDSQSGADQFFGGAETAKNPMGAKFSDAAAVAGLGKAEAGANAESTEGVESIVKNVNFLTKKGGGEMKVQLNQEGLGEVHLKVAVNEGKVNIQMLTDNKDTKKLLESDLSALKVELGEKKIDLQDIKVDVQKDLRGNLEEQFADQRREQTRQFWQQFKEENEMNRAMAINRGLPSYNSGRKMPTDVIDDVQASGAYRSKSIDGRLNVVA